MNIFEMAFFYGDYSSLPTSDELFKNDQAMWVQQELFT